jgi:hypothetical protein
MVGNVAKGIFVNWTGTLNKSCSVDMKGATKMMIAKDDANAMCGHPLWVEVGLATGFVSV